MSPIRLALGVFLLGTALTVLWIVAGARIVAMLDGLTTAPDGASPAPGWFAIEDGREAALSLGGRRWTIPATWRLSENPAGHVTVETPQGPFVLGTILRAYETGDDHRSYDFIPDAGDAVTLTRRRSRVAWPRPLAFNILGGQHATAGRYVYHYVTWRKQAGREIEVVWRDEQRYTPGGGWSDRYIPTPPRVTLRDR